MRNEMADLLGRPAFVDMGDGECKVINAMSYKRLKYDNGEIIFWDNYGRATFWNATAEEGHGIIDQVSKLPSYFKIAPGIAINLMSYESAKHHDGRIVFHDTNNTNMTMTLDEYDARETLECLSNCPSTYRYNDSTVLILGNIRQIELYDDYMEFRYKSGSPSYEYPSKRDANIVLSDASEFPNCFILNPRNVINANEVNRTALIGDEFVLFDNRNGTTAWSADYETHKSWFKKYRRTGQQLYVSPFSPNDPYDFNDALCVNGLGAIKQKYNQDVCTQEFLSASALICGKGIGKAFDGPAKMYSRKSKSPNTPGL